MGELALAVGSLRKGLHSWFTLGDYDAAKANALRAIFARFTRGNTVAQDGDSLDDEDAARALEAGDRAMEQLAREVGRR